MSALRWWGLVSLGLVLWVSAVGCGGGAATGGHTDGAAGATGIDSRDGGAGTGGVAGTSGMAGAGGRSGAGGAADAGGATDAGGTVDAGLGDGRSAADGAVDSGAGGVAGTGGIGGVGGAGGGAPQIQVRALCRNDSSLYRVNLTFDVVNPSAATINLADVTVRYYLSYAIVTAAAPIMTVDDTGLLPFSALAASYASRYVEISFPSTTVQLLPYDAFFGSGPIEVHFHASDDSSWDNEYDDVSYRPCLGASPTLLTPRETMTGYIGGRLSWGNEPP